MSERGRNAEAWVCPHGQDKNVLCAKCVKERAAEVDIVDRSLQRATGHSSRPPEGGSRTVSDVAPKRSPAQIEADRVRAEQESEGFETDAKELLEGVDEQRLKNLMDAYGTQKKPEPAIQAMLLAFDAARGRIAKIARTPMGGHALREMQRQGNYKYTLGEALKQMPVQARKKVLHTLQTLAPLSEKGKGG